MRSVDSKQLGGENSTTSACQPFSNINIPGSPDYGIINPCGLIAHSNFNDTITVINPGIVLDVRAPLRLGSASGNTRFRTRVWVWSGR